mmetsp:Transcript_2291/g.6760  ORF Transcript_2291/g.6760 Transcript_2291/m.6760 type:complete len:229 (+) Transcript_2291:1195-1881(+)
MEDPAQDEEHHDGENQANDGHGEYRAAEQNPPDPLAPRVIPVDTASDRVDAADALKLRPGGLELLAHAQRAPLQRVRRGETPPEVHEENGPEAHAYAKDDGRGVVWRMNQALDTGEDDAHQSRDDQPLVEVRHEEEVQSNPLAVIVSHLVDVLRGAPREALEPVRVEFPQLVVFVHGEVVKEVPIVHQLANVHPRAVVVARTDNVVDESDAVARAEDGPRLRVGLVLR